MEEINMMVRFKFTPSRIIFGHSGLVLIAMVFFTLKKLPISKLGNSPLEIVEEYTYLGILWNGNFAKAKKIADKATRAMYSVIQEGSS
jgi:hypothetical protein